MGEPVDLRVQLGCDRTNAEPLKRMYKSMGKAMQTVAMRHDAFPLHIVENPTHLLGRELMVVEERNEVRDGPLKIDVVLPERVVSVEEEGLGKQAFRS